MTFHCDRGEYDGEWSLDEITGKGKATFKPQGIVAQGEWQRGMLHGRGCIQFANDDRYEGEFCNGMRSGQGVLTMANGDAYAGQWDSDLPNGEGRFTSSNGDIFTGRVRRPCCTLLTLGLC